MDISHDIALVEKALVTFEDPDLYCRFSRLHKGKMCIIGHLELAAGLSPGQLHGKEWEMRIDRIAKMLGFPPIADTYKYPAYVRHSMSMAIFNNYHPHSEVLVRMRSGLNKAKKKIGIR